MTNTNETANTYKSEYVPVSDYTREELMSEQVLSVVCSLNGVKRQQVMAELTARARQLGCVRVFNEAVKAYAHSLCEIARIGSGKGQTNFPDGRDPLKLCGRFETDRDGIYIMKETENGEIEKSYICRTPVLPVALMTNIDSHNESVRLSYYLDGAWHDTVVDRLTLSDSGKITALTNLGISFRSGKSAEALCEFMSDCIDSNRETLPKGRSVSRLGWHGSDFIPYSDSVVFDGEKEFKCLFEAIKESGDFEVWRTHMLKLRENIAVRLLMGASFASPLLTKLGALPFVFHLWGTSGCGKTVALMAAMSIWGDPEGGKLVRTMNTTANAAMTAASVLGNIPYAGDELQTVKESGTNCDKLIMTLCEGIDRGRMKYDKMCETRTWSCAFLFTGEEPITTDTSGGGAKNRVVEVECRDTIIGDGNASANLVRANHGHAGRRFIDYINSKKLRLSESYASFKKTLESGDVTDKQASAMAAIVLGDTIARSAIFPEEKTLTPEDVLAYMKSKREADPSVRAFEYIRDVITVNISRFERKKPQNGIDEPVREDIPRADNYGETWGKLADEGRVYINKTVLVRLLSEGGYTFDAVKNAWSELGWLERDSRGKLFHQNSLGGMRMSLIKLNLS